MRKQYHSRKTKEGHLIWDVDNLVEEAKDLQVVEVRVEDISELDESYWFEIQTICERLVPGQSQIISEGLKVPINIKQ